MDLIDKLLVEWSWRCKKGYPDLTSADDLQILREVFGIDLTEAKHEFSYLSSEAQAVAKELMQALGIDQDSIKAATKNKIVLLVDTPRAEVFSKLEDLGFERDATMSGSSGGGYRSPEGIEVIHKPASSAATGGAGVDNEHALTDAINSAIEQHGPITVVIKGPKNTLTYKGVKKAIHVGKEGEAKGWKGDAQLITADGEKHISIKKDGGYRWESAITRYRPFYEMFMQKAYDGKLPKLELKPDPANPRVLQMMNPDNNKPYGRVYITGHPQLEADTYEMAFGPDNADIVQRTFTPSDFNFEGDTLTINASRVIASADGVAAFEKKELPIIEFERNASKATKTDGPFGRGIIMRTSPQGRVDAASSRANNLVLTYDQVMK